MAQEVKNSSKFFTENGAARGFRLARVGLFIHSWEFAMNTFTSAIKTFIDDENGVTAIEYGLIAALVGLALIAGATTLGEKLSASFEYIALQMKSAPAA